MASRDVVVIQVRGLSLIYNAEVSKELYMIWHSALVDLTDEELLLAISRYVKENNAFMPKPGQIYQLAKGPALDPELEASSLVETIIYEVSTHGSPPGNVINRHNEMKAREKIGEIGWAFIQKCGGWHKFSTQFTEDCSMETIKSQIRKSLMGLIIARQTGMETMHVEHRTLNSLGVIMKDLNEHGRKTCESDLSRLSEQDKTL